MRPIGPNAHSSISCTPNEGHRLRPKFGNPNLALGVEWMSPAGMLEDSSAFKRLEYFVAHVGRLQKWKRGNEVVAVLNIELKPRIVDRAVTAAVIPADLVAFPHTSLQCDGGAVNGSD